MPIGAITYFTGLLANLFLIALLFSSWRGNIRGRWLIVAAVVSSIWCAVLALQERYGLFPADWVWTAEVIRSVVWLQFVAKLLGTSKTPQDQAERLADGPLRVAVNGLGVLQLAYVWLGPYLERHAPALVHTVSPVLGFTLIALLGLLLVEQYFRNARADLRWRIKFLCLGLGAMFAFDFYMYSNAVLFRRIDPDLWASRGAVWALMTPLIAISASRNPDWSVDIFVSRQFIFHSATLLVTGVYLLLMAIAGYYIRARGGEWGSVAQIVFLVAAFVFLGVLMFSGQMRARLRVFLSKHFFNYAYDYRHEWFRIIHTLSETRSELPFEQRLIVALGQVVESPSGVLWVRDRSGHLNFRASFGDPGFQLDEIRGDDPAVQFMAKNEWIVNLQETLSLPDTYDGLTRPSWMDGCDNAWLLIPLLERDGSLIGLLLLTKPRTPIHWNWEVIDLLKTSSRLAASYLAFEDAGRELAEARQFEGFNRLSAFVIHDLKNLIAQLSLVVRNAERHHNNPDFMRDAIKTVDHATGKMSRLMSQLRNLGAGQSQTDIEIGSLLQEVVQARKAQLPEPQYQRIARPVLVSANHDRLGSALEHLIQNAQDAAGRHGNVWVRAGIGQNGEAVIDIEDDGCGMDAEFVRSRLFKPFDTTKGLTGMGIGAYESREYIRSLGGELHVHSEPGKGSLFNVVIPRSPSAPR